VVVETSKTLMVWPKILLRVIFKTWLCSIYQKTWSLKVF